MKILPKNIYIYLSLFFSLIASSCTDEFKDYEGETTPPEEDGYCLSFGITLSVMTRDGGGDNAGEDYEDAIDLDKVRLLFFYGEKKKDGSENSLYNTLIRQFRADKKELYLIPLRSPTDNSLKKWYVRIPIKTAEDETFANTLRENDFKISVLANWPGDTPDFELGDHIKKLHFLDSKDSYVSTKTYYDVLKDSKYEGMGMSTGWIEDGRNSKNAANAYIRQNYDPSTGETEGYPDFKYLWLLWNFDNAFKYAEPDKDSEIPDDAEEDGPKDIDKKWAAKNHADLKDWLQTSGNLSSFAVENSDNGKFEYKGEGATFGKPKNNNVEVEDAPYGVILPKSEDYQTNSINFKVVASGNLKIKWGSADGNNAKLKLELRNHIVDSTPSQYKEPSGSSDAINEYTWPITVNGDSQYLSIFSQNGNVIIYEIEYIQDDYIYYIDREGRGLNESRLIPMYGVQCYDALYGYWPEGTLFDLSNFDNISNKESENSAHKYDFKPVWMLRSLAKVVLKIPTNIHPEYVYLRSQNRAARCEPMDVSTPTNLLWVDGDDDNLDNINCEWSKLIGHAPFYNPDSPADETTQEKNYQSKLAWYYGTWKEFGHTLGDFPIVKGEGSEDRFGENEYPKIFNPRINRSDFNRFIYTGKQGIYERYVLYVPEKYVDDPNDVGVVEDKPGMEKSDPKILHIEFRTPYYSHDNLEDNGCYRIYFTENGFFDNDGKNKYPTFGKIKDENDNPTSIDETWENTYEQNVNNLKHHWPILRNHVYSFTVKDIENHMVVLNLEVLPWKMVDDENIYYW